MNPEKFLKEEDIKDTVQVKSKLFIYNSNHYWDDVILQLQKATGFELVHCEQIAILAHTTGKAVVKSGNVDDLIPINNILKEINLVTEIE